VSGADPIARLVRRLVRLPGIGEKSATRLAFHILRSSESQARELAQAIIEVHEKIRLCSTCCHLTETDPCDICGGARGGNNRVWVVGDPAARLARERGGHYRGVYHVLHGVLSPLDGVGPDDLRIAALMRRLGPATTAAADDSSVVTEVILATSPSVEGEATAMYLARLIKPLGVKVTRIASGVPIGGELEYVDQVTLTRALGDRREL